jgi:hypothetical protein
MKTVCFPKRRYQPAGSHCVTTQKTNIKIWLELSVTQTKMERSYGVYGFAASLERRTPAVRTVQFMQKVSYKKYMTPVGPE